MFGALAYVVGLGAAFVVAIGLYTVLRTVKLI
ncbi:MAG: cytochrome b6-f complex subunit 6 [Leptolyngbyaceae cyanobacterium SL_7_1]|nr:cytochrome b6-f complex subunit 6 [Leptolyngbyaceae cyanobacterium SL_7_1]